MRRINNNLESSSSMYIFWINFSEILFPKQRVLSLNKFSRCIVNASKRENRPTYLKKNLRVYHSRALLCVYVFYLCMHVCVCMWNKISRCKRCNYRDGCLHSLCVYARNKIRFLSLCSLCSFAFFSSPLLFLPSLHFCYPLVPSFRFSSSSIAIKDTVKINSR